MFVNGKTLVRTRFAPSPTGYLHIGGARTALFNYLFAKRYGGSFILRVDDTDTGRNIDAAVKPILDGLKWLGIEWDEGPIFQSVRKDHYRDIAEALIKMGHAYPDDSNSPDDDIIKNKKAYRGKCRNMASAQAFDLYDDSGWAVRYKVPEDEEIVLDDLVKGEVKFNTSRISDPIILRSNGTPTYNFATVVDDAEMKITHVIRAEEHLSNTPVQLLLMDDLGYVPPFYAHVPFVCEPGSNKKLSKREMGKFVTPEVIAKLREIGFAESEIDKRDELNPATLSYYNALGFKPQAIANYLARLGWSLDGETEIMSMNQMQDNFSLDRIVTGPAQFDPKKLMWTAAEHTKMDAIETKASCCTEYLIHANLIETPVSPVIKEKIQKVVEICGDRIKVYSDILPYGSFFFRKPIYNIPDVEKRLNKDIVVMLDIFVQHLRQMVLWSAETLEDKVREFMDGYGLKPNNMVYALRVAITGTMIGPSLFHAMEFLGKEETLKRCYDALNLIPKEKP